jgi:hypothetical protein
VAELSLVVLFKASEGNAGCEPPLPATRLPSWACPASRSFRTPRLAAFWFAAPSLPFLRLRGLRREAPSGTAVPAAPTGLSVPPGYDPASFARAPVGTRAAFLRFRTPTAVATCRSPLSRRIQPPVRSALGVSHARDGLLLQQAPGPFQAGAAPGVLPTELCSSRAAARLSAPLLSCRSQKPRSSTLRFFGRSRFSAATEPCSARRVRTPRGCRPADRPMLSWDFASPGLSPERHGQRFRRPSRTHFGFAAPR